MMAQTSPQVWNHNFLAGLVDARELRRIARTKDLAPESGGDHQPLLRAPVVPKGDAIEGECQGLSDDRVFEAEHDIQHPLGARAIEYQILEQILKAAQESGDVEARDAEAETDEAVLILGNGVGQTLEAPGSVRIRGHITLQRFRVGEGMVAGLAHRVVEALPDVTPFRHARLGGHKALGGGVADGEGIGLLQVRGCNSGAARARDRCARWRGRRARENP